METTGNLDALRGNALAEIERTERGYRMAFLGAVFVEALFLAAFLLLADLRDRVHVLLLLGFVSGYTLVVLGLIALGAHVKRVGLTVLKAIDARH